MGDEDKELTPINPEGNESEKSEQPHVEEQATPLPVAPEQDVKLEKLRAESIMSELGRMSAQNPENTTQPQKTEPAKSEKRGFGGLFRKKESAEEQERARKIEETKRTFYKPTEASIEKALRQLEPDIPDITAEVATEFLHAYWFPFKDSESGKLLDPRDFLKKPYITTRIMAANGLVLAESIEAQAKGQTLTPKDREEISKMLAGISKEFTKEEAKWTKVAAETRSPKYKASLIEDEEDYEADEWEDMQSMIKGAQANIVDNKARAMKNEAEKLKMLSGQVSLLEKFAQHHASIGEEGRRAITDPSQLKAGRIDAYWQNSWVDAINESIKRNYELRDRGPEQKEKEE